ncbi:hypothetical protein BKA82DRAFT_4018599 [Pisolithus tinctorius]|nr:hypothetical protein BKA82DRAFT_4018599 [Pisolithus tinctorius]
MGLPIFSDRFLIPSMGPTISFDGCSMLQTGLSTGCGAPAPTTTTWGRPPRSDANSGMAKVEGTTVLKLKEAPTDDVPGPPATEVPDAAPSKAKPLRGRKQTPVNNEVHLLNKRQPSASSEPTAVGGRKVPTAPKRPPSRAKGVPTPEVVVEPKVTRNKPIVTSTRPKSHSGTTKAGQRSLSAVPATAAARRMRSGVRRGGGIDKCTWWFRFRFEVGQVNAQRNCHAAEENGPGSKRRTRTATMTAMKARWDKVEGGVAGPAGRTRRTPTPSMVKPPRDKCY